MRFSSCHRLTLPIAHLWPPKRRGGDSYPKPLAWPPVAPFWRWRPFPPRSLRPPLAPSGVDPIFALIEDYQTAAKAVAAAASEVERREEMLIEQGLGPDPFISVLDASGPRNPQPTTVYTHEHIDLLLPVDRFGKPNAAAHTSLDAQIERHKAVVGDSEKVLYAAQDAETEAVDELVWTPPKTIAGVLALLELLPELRRARVMDDDDADDSRTHNLGHRRLGRHTSRARRLGRITVTA